MKKYISLNILSILGYIVIFLWIIHFITLGHHSNNWFSHPIYTLLILCKQTFIILGLLIVFLIEYLLKKNQHTFFLIKSENKIYNFLFKLGYIFLVIPFLILASSLVFLPLIKFFNLKIIATIIIIATILEMIFITYFLFKKQRL